MTIDEMKDRIDIQELLSAYCHALDARDWDRFVSLFVESAEFDYSDFDGPVCGLQEVAEYLRTIMSSMSASLHTVSTTSISLSGSTATAYSAGMVYLVPLPGGAEGAVVNVGLWYSDEFVKGRQGWQFSKRRQKKALMFVAQG